MPISEEQRAAQAVNDAELARKQRFDTVRRYGGIKNQDVIDALVVVPNGWVLDEVTDYWVSPNVIETGKI